MIHITCPSCDASSRIPDEKVNTAILCKKCLKTFHVKASGHAVPGGPPVAPGSVGHKVDHSLNVEEALEKVNAGLHRLAPIAIAFAGLVGGFVAYQWSQPTIEQRTTAMATALARGDQSTIRKLSVPGTDDLAVEWLKTLQPDVRESIQSTESTTPVVTVIATQPTPGTSEVAVRARLSPEILVGRRSIASDASPSQAARATSIDVPLVLAGGLWRGWRLDGARSLEAVRKNKGLDSRSARAEGR